MLTTDAMRTYLQAHAIQGTNGGSTAAIDATPDDPVLLQAQADGYADRVDGRWVARGYIQPGERRIVRYTSGGMKEVVGE